MTKKPDFIGMGVVALVLLVFVAAVWYSASRIPVQTVADNAHIWGVRHQCDWIKDKYFGKGNRVQMDPATYADFTHQLDECNKSNETTVTVPIPR